MPSTHVGIVLWDSLAPSPMQWMKMENTLTEEEEEDEEDEDCLLPRNCGLVGWPT